MLQEKKLARLMERYPAIEDLAQKARKRMPFVGWEYLESGTGDEQAVLRNRKALDTLTFTPRIIRGGLKPDIRTEVLGQAFEAPFGVAPVGLTGLMWPRAECMLAEMAQVYGIPYCLSTVATQVPEVVGPYAKDRGWFQLYPPKEEGLRKDLLRRARESGFATLVITADVPAPSRRERTKRAGMRMPPKITPGFIWQGITHPRWSLGTLNAGLPRLRTVESYSNTSDLKKTANFVRFNFRGDLTWEYVEAVRAEWDGPVVLKGVLHPEDAQRALDAGMDGVGVSNHGGRQFNGVIPAIEALPQVVDQVGGKMAVIFDSGIRSGLDILRALSLGADFVLLGRPFLYGVGALGKYGAALVTEILKDDLKNNMVQLGVEQLEAIKTMKTFSDLVDP